MTVMCRLFGLLSQDVISGRRWLIDSERSLLKQSNHNPEGLQRDGWGIGWYDETNRIHTQKGIGGAFEPREKEHFRLAAGSAKSRVVVGHLRHASNPMQLPEEKLRGLVNSQPFDDGRVLFAHNGSIPLPVQTRSLLGALDSQVKGVNDSEVFFWLLVKHLHETRNPLNAYAASQRDVVRIWEQEGRPGEHPYSGLNVILTTGPTEMWAFCAYVGEYGTHLYDDGLPYYQMVYQRAPERVIIASEPFDSRLAEWTPLTNGQFLHARIERGQVALQTGEIPIVATVSA
jgi:predicted glutamine amidotransferase